MTVRLAPCGTRSGYARHKRWGEEACGPCKAAQNAYLRDYRSRTAAAAVNEWYRRTRQSAFIRLSREFPARYLELLDEERVADPRPRPEEAQDRAA